MSSSETFRTVNSSQNSKAQRTRKETAYSAMDCTFSVLFVRQSVAHVQPTVIEANPCVLPIPLFWGVQKRARAHAHTHTHTHIYIYIYAM
jgi:hypothetical protein